MAADKEISSTPQRKKGIWSFIWIPMALVLALAAGGLTGVLGSYYLNNSRATTEVSALATYRPSEVTKIYAADNETVIAEFALEKRIPLKEDEIPEKFENALISIEDTRFYDHIGIDPYRLLGAVVRNITTGRKEGASTLTQQLAKNLFLTKDQTVTRKANEWVMALQIERLYTKRQILTMYVNYVFFGAGAYGVEAASRTYFNKPSKDLSVEEAALLAAIPKSPSDYAPIHNPERALERRNLVLDQMVKNDKLSAADAEAAKAKPIKLADTAYYQSQPKSTAWDYPVEEVRKYLEDKYTTRVAQGGLKVYTSIDPEAQEIASKSIRQRLREYDRTKEWRSEYQNILLDDDNNPLTDQKQIDSRLKSFKHPDWYGDEYEKDSYIKGLVINVNAEKNEATVRFGQYQTIVTSKEMGRCKNAPKDEFKVGMLPEFQVLEVNSESKTLKIMLSQVPEVQAAIVSINSKTGEIAAMIGGYDFHTNKFNNATQGFRQTGSSFKPFIYTAAIEMGFTPDMLVSGAPIRKGGWMPHNYDGTFSHPNVPMKIALAKSYNIAAVHLLEQVGIQTASQMVRRFGITNPMAPVLPSALGATEVPLIEMVSAYSCFPNKGVRVEPHLIRKVLDRDGRVLEEWNNTTFKVTSEYVASTMVEMMQGVVRAGGTATSASAGGHPLAGKTGTVNDHTDVWFIGYTPTYTTGVWMGNPLKKENLGNNMTGGHGAVPYFNGFMVPFMQGRQDGSFSKPPDMPADIKVKNEQLKREEIDKLDEADRVGQSLGIVYSSNRNRSGGGNGGGGTRKSTGSSGSDGVNVPTNNAPAKIEDNTKVDAPVNPGLRGDDDSSKPIIVKPKPVEPKKPTLETTKKPDSTTDKPKVDPPKKKGKKGDDEP